MARQNKTNYSPFLLLLCLLFSLAGRTEPQATPDAGSQAPGPELEEELENINPVFDSKWYQVEIIIFANNQPDTNEQWDTGKRLEKYPGKFLVIEHPWQDEIDEIQKDSTARQQLDERYVTFLEKAWVDSEKLFGAWNPLPQEQWLLNQLEKSLNYRSRYSVLYHQSWVQPLRERSISIPLVVQAGDIYGDYHEIDGSIGLSVSRYIHLDTDLWLRKFSALQPLQEHSIDPITGKMYSEHQNRLETDVESAFPDPEVKRKSFVISRKPLFIKEEGTYFVENQVHIDESRRMKSEELHYLDHPLFGLLIKIVPFEHPELLRKEMLEEMLEIDNDS